MQKLDFYSKHFDLSAEFNCVVIGEIGVNHNKDLDMLIRLIEEGVKAGVDVIKLQRFSAKAEISGLAPLAAYQKKGSLASTQLEMAEKLELPDEWLFKARDLCKALNVGFLCAGFDHDSVEFISAKLACKTIKSPSPELSNKPLLQQMGRSFDGILLSTGASYLSECANAIDWINDVGNASIGIMHCVSEYPAPINEVNLNVLKTMRKAFELPVGYSDHTEGILAPIVASTLGATFIEKHFTLDKNLEGPDHKASADLAELKNLVTLVKEAKETLGSFVKKPSNSELENREVIRKSVTANVKELMPGTQITPALLGIKRPFVSGAVQPCHVENIIGLTIKKRKAFDEPIFWSDFWE